MAGAHITQAQLQSFSECLHRIYNEPAGENPVQALLDAVEQLVRVNSLAVDETKGDGSPQGGGTRLLRHQHLGSRGFEGYPWVESITVPTAHDHPITQHVLRRGIKPVLKLSDFVSQRQLRNISLYEFNKKVHEWRDQSILLLPTASGTMSISLNRDRVYTEEEFFLLKLLQPHLQSVINRCALFKRLPGNNQLTPREREVLYWITMGKRDEEIAMILQSKPGTVNKQVRSILQKLGAENRTSAVSIVLAK